MYTGLFMPDGSVPPVEMIMNNGKMNRDAENKWMNSASYLSYLYRLMDIAISVFEWHDLPKGIDQRMLEYWLLQNGFVVFFHDEDLKESTNGNAPEGYAVLPAMISGQWDMYNYPIDRRAYATNGMNVTLNETNSEFIFNDYLRVPMFPTLQLYAKRLAEVDRTIDINVMNQKCPKIVRGDENERLTFENFMSNVEQNKSWFWAYKSLDLSNVEVLDVSSPYVSNDLQILKHQLWNEVLTYLGVENVNTEKKERLVSSEVMTSMGDVEVSRFTRLNAREQACDKINELFNLNVSVTFRSGTYVKADGYGSQQVAVTGMQTGEAGNDGGGYSTSNNGWIGKLKGALDL